ncbi:Hypothetical predicted protein [Prunus dulcis]|uniref:Uncharacterized protein n=1 Tax=Prunus dulcis TaxID=3755 RepID=A0A5E4FNM1_PRUDU|nr:Hypothetical predicted protein [Prunus dulcis]
MENTRQILIPSPSSSLSLRELARGVFLGVVPASSDLRLSWFLLLNVLIIPLYITQ